MSSTIMEKLLLIFVFIILQAINPSDCLRCYACGEVNTFLAESYTNVKPCRDFDDITDPRALASFAIDCPSEYLGCITQKQGNQVLRSCDTFAIDDCQTANGVTYCYCKDNLCNGRIPDQTLPYTDFTDDEDYSDMSGFGETPFIKEGSEEVSVRSNSTATPTEANGSSSGVMDDPIKQNSSPREQHSDGSRTEITFYLVGLLQLYSVTFS